MSFRPLFIVEVDAEVGMFVFEAARLLDDTGLEEEAEASAGATEASGLPRAAAPASSPLLMLLGFSLLPGKV